MAETRDTSAASSDESRFGVPRIKAGPDGRAVRLAMVVRHLMALHQMARADAVTTCLLPPLEGIKPPALYLLQPGGNAQPLGGREWFATGSGRPGPATTGLRVLSAGIGRGAVAAPMAASLGHGVAGLAAWLRAVWGSAKNSDAACLDDAAALASYVAVGEADAVAVWGWGAVGDGEVGAATVTQPVADAWDDARLWARHQALKASGVHAFTKKLAAESGIKERDITRRLKAFKEDHRPPTASVFTLVQPGNRSKRSPG